MKIIKICPQCSTPALDVPVEVVLNLTSDECKDKINRDKKWYVCVNPSCKTSYFNDFYSFKTNDIKIEMWFKTNSMFSPICYCSGLTRNNIKEAVENGCNSIDDVQKYTEKNITGKCNTMNVIGRCCRNVFLYEIEKYKKL